MSAHKQFLYPTVILLIVALSWIGGLNIATAQVVPGQHIVVFKENVANPNAAAADAARAHGLGLIHTYSFALKGFAATVPPGRLAALQRDPRVAYVEPDLVATAFGHLTPTGVDRIDADLNNTANIDDVDDRVNVDIAIIDTGIDLDHPDLNVVQHKSFIRRVKKGDDDNGHGTHVAGTAAALDNGIGVVGVAPGARLWALKVLDRNGSGFFSDVIKGIDYVTANATAIEVANMSLGGVGRLDSLRTAIQNSVAAGVVYVVAAGNSSQDVYGDDGVFETSDDFIPAAYPEVAAISAMGDTDGQAGGIGPNTSRGTADDTFADFTNFSNSVVVGNPVTSSGAAIDVAAPGVDILSTWNDGGYNTISGTSMASPHMAGAAALEAATSGRATNAAGVAAIRQALIDAAEAQSAWGPANTNDPDTNPEGLANVQSGPPNNAPTVSITNPTDGSTFSSGAMIPFAGTASDTEDGNLTASLAWTSSIDGSIGTGGLFSRTLSDGNHIITASVTDSGGKTGSDAISITVGNPPDTVSVNSITYATEGGKNGDKHLLITIALVNNGGGPVAGASVSINLFRDGSLDAQGTGTTGTDGTVTFSRKNAPNGCYTTTVTNVTAAGLTWDGITPLNEFCKGVPGAPPAHVTLRSKPIIEGLIFELKRVTPSVVKVEKTVLRQNYPNPFNPETWIPFELSRSEHVFIQIYNSTGELARTLDLGVKPAGVYVSRDQAAYWNGKNANGERVASGVYFYRMEAGTFSAMKKLVIMK
jgi:subtilisin family serine protease